MEELNKLTTPEQFNNIILTIAKINRFLGEEYFPPDLGLEFDLKLFQIIEIPDEILQNYSLDEIQNKIKKLIFDELENLKLILQKQFKWINRCFYVNKNYTYLIIIPHENFLFDYTTLYDTTYKLINEAEKNPDFALKFSEDINNSINELKNLHDKIISIINDLKQIKQIINKFTIKFKTKIWNLQ